LQFGEISESRFADELAFVPGVLSTNGPANSAPPEPEAKRILWIIPNSQYFQLGAVQTAHAAREVSAAVAHVPSVLLAAQKICAVPGSTSSAT
jgi:hypothetical protein